MKKTTTRGFTLIELLVVIAIIGLLSTVVVASLTTVRAKARDSKRLSDLQSIAKVIATLDNGFQPVTLTGCTADMADLTSCSNSTAFTNFKDPSSPASVCAPGATAPCKYGISDKAGADDATSQDYQVCTFLETNSGPVTSSAGGMANISPDGVIAEGCL